MIESNEKLAKYASPVKSSHVQFPDFEISLSILPESAYPSEVWEHFSPSDKLQHHIKVRVILQKLNTNETSLQCNMIIISNCVLTGSLHWSVLSLMCEAIKVVSSWVLKFGLFGPRFCCADSRLETLCVITQINSPHRPTKNPSLILW